MRSLLDDQFINLIDIIYEAGALPDRWPGALAALADHVDAKGAILMKHSGDDRKWMLSPAIAPLMEIFVADGWMQKNPRIDNYNAAFPYAGFQLDDDFMVRSEFETWPIYREFFIPHGLATGAGTVVQGAKIDGMLITVEGFRDTDAGRRAIPTLDGLRPHIARASLLSAQLQLRAVKAAVTALELIGTPAAMLDNRGRVQCANQLFQRDIGRTLYDRRSRLHLSDRASDILLDNAFAVADVKTGRSIPLRRAERSPAALHLIPIRGSARDIFVQSAWIAIVAEPDRRLAPKTNLLQLLFDLTPREASVARLLAENHTLSSAAMTLGIGSATAKTHLKSVFQKTGTKRQGELIGLLSGFSTVA